MGYLRIYKEINKVKVLEEGKLLKYFEDFDFEIDATTVYLRCKYNEYSKDYKVLFADLQDEDGNVIPESYIPTYLEAVGKNKVDATIQDSTAPIIITHFTKLLTETTVAIQPAKGDYILNVTDATGFVVDQYLTIYSVASNRVSFYHILAINTLAITLDTPIDFEYAVGDFVSVGDADMSVNGSVTPQIFGVRNPTGQDIALAFDVSRIIFAIECVGAVNLSQFGDIAGGILRGIVLRQVDGTYRNIFNAKTNAELKSLMYDVDIQTALGSQPAGVTGRLTFGSQSKLGVVVRLKSTEDLQLIVQDDLTSLTRFFIMAEGSEVTD